MSAPARVLVVDDSPTMRGLISAILSSDPDVDVVGQAGDAMEAREAIKRLNPDVVTLDIEMPNMNGLDFLEKIMTLRPMPVIMVSSLTHRGADATLAALEIGAFDCIGKPAPASRARSMTWRKRSRLRPVRNTAMADRLRRPRGSRRPISTVKTPIALVARSWRSDRPPAASRR